MRRAGIWQGRFQVIHNGHYHVFSTTLKQFNEKFVAIVNPNPKVAACNPKVYDQFREQRNPFTYFVRMLLWKQLADEQNMDVMFFPCWHARRYIALENEFLPDKNDRSWIVAVGNGCEEQGKKEDLEGDPLYENVTDSCFSEEPDKLKGITASQIRGYMREGQIEKACQSVPACISQATINFYNGRESYEYRGCDKNKYFIVPFLNEQISLSAVQTACNLAKDQPNTYVIFMISVPVENSPTVWKDESNLPWWFRSSCDDGHKSYYLKSKKIYALMKRLGMRNFLVTPTFLMNNNAEMLGAYNNAFLPHHECAKFVLGNDETNWKNLQFNYWLEDIYTYQNEGNYTIFAGNQPISDIIANAFRQFCYSTSTQNADTRDKSALVESYRVMLNAELDKTKSRLRLKGISETATRQITEKYVAEMNKLVRMDVSYDQLQLQLEQLQIQWEQEFHDLAK